MNSWTHFGIGTDNTGMCPMPYLEALNDGPPQDTEHQVNAVDSLFHIVFQFVSANLAALAFAHLAHPAPDAFGIPESNLGLVWAS